MQDVLTENILRFWMERMQDRENGGFYGRIDGHEVLHPEAEKGAILNARILWTFSAAYRVFSQLSPQHPHLSDYLKMATRAKEYFIDHFIDSSDCILIFSNLFFANNVTDINFNHFCFSLS